MKFVNIFAGIYKQGRSWRAGGWSGAAAPGSRVQMGGKINITDENIRFSAFNKL